MNWRPVAALPALLPVAAASAQPADLPIPPATTGEYPPGVSVAETASGSVYVDSHERTLYGMDMRTLLRAGADPSKYCKDECARQWEPLLAPAGTKVNIAYPSSFGERIRRDLEASPEAKPAMEDEEGDKADFHANPQKAPDWTVIQGPQGAQWVYKGWHMVYVRKGDAPGSTAFDGAGNFTWNTLKYVPPVPQISAPAVVTTVFVGGKYALADKEGRVLFTGDCGDDCSAWQPLPGGLASRSVGEWSVTRSGDTPQWAYRGQRVFFSQHSDPAEVPPAGAVLRP